MERLEDAQAGLVSEEGTGTWPVLNTFVTSEEGLRTSCVKVTGSPERERYCYCRGYYSLWSAEHFQWNDSGQQRPSCH